MLIPCLALFFSDFYCVQMHFDHLVQPARQQCVPLYFEMVASPSLWLPYIGPSDWVVASDNIGQEQLVLWRSAWSSWRIDGLSPNVMPRIAKPQTFKKTNHRGMFYPLRTPTNHSNPTKNIIPNKLRAKTHERRAQEHLTEAKALLDAIEMIVGKQ